MRVLIVAEHASVRFGGEASLPYHYFRLMRERAMDAWLIVHERTREELSALFPEEKERILYVKDMVAQKVFYRISLYLPRRIAEPTFGLANQLLTQYAQRGMLRRLITDRTVIHQPIPVAPRFPSLLYGLHAPVVSGPLNGGMHYPPAFHHAESGFIRFLVGVGRAWSDVVHRIFPGKRLASIVLVANERTQAALPAGVTGRVQQLVENGVDLTRWQAQDVIAPVAGSTRFLFIGRLVDWKALDLVLAALERVPDATLDVIGDGPMRAAWQAQAATPGLQNRVRFLGWLSQQECAVYLQQAVALVLPSLFECGGAVVLEAMAMSKPVIATDWGGPADYIDASCGMLIPPDSREGLIAGFATAMQTLLSHPEMCVRMGAAGREKILRLFDWEKKADEMVGIYQQALAFYKETH